MHIHETAQEIADSLAAHGCRPLARLARLGVLGSNLIGVHAVHVDEPDIELLARHGCSVAHCPTSNMKLASGIAPVPRLLAAGIPVGLGTDGAASNNRLDLLQEMRHAALLAKVGSLDATAVPAHAALRMATLDGARALGMDDRIGSIEIGKCADLCALELSAPQCRPCFDPVSHLVYVCGRENVSHVWIGVKPAWTKASRCCILTTPNCSGSCRCGKLGSVIELDILVQTDTKTADSPVFISFSGNSGDSPFKEETMIKQSKKQMLMLAAIASIGLSAPSALRAGQRRRRCWPG